MGLILSHVNLVRILTPSSEMQFNIIPPLSLGLRLPWRFPTNTLYAFPIPICMPHILPILSSKIQSPHNYSVKNTIYEALHLISPSYYILSPNILLSILFSNTLKLCSTFRARDQVLHPYKYATVLFHSRTQFLSRLPALRF